MKIDFGKHRGKELECLPESYLNWLHSAYKPLIIELEKILIIVPVKDRIERKDVSELFKKFKARYPDNQGLAEFQKALINKFYNF